MDANACPRCGHPDGWELKVRARLVFAEVTRADQRQRTDILRHLEGDHGLFGDAGSKSWNAPFTL